MFRRRRIAIILCLVLALALAWGGFALWSYHASQSFLNQAIAETDALDPRWRLADILADRKSIPDDQNSALTIMAGHRLLKNNDPQLRDNVEKAADQDWDCQNRCFNDQQKAALSQLVAMHVPALEEYRKIAAMPYGRHPFTWNLMSQGSQFASPNVRVAMYTLRFDLRDRLAVGDYEKANQRILGMINVAPSLGDEPFGVTILVRCAIDRMADLAVCEWLAKSKPNETILSHVQRALEIESALPLATMYAKGERATGIESLEQMTALAPPPANPWEALQSLVGNSFANAGFLPRQKAYHLKMMNRIIEITNDPEKDQLNQLAVCKNSLPQDAILARLHVPALEKILTSIHRAHAGQLCTITALAAERFRIQNQRWPNNFDELVTAGLLKSAPIDPFDGQPLRWKTTENGRLIYSIGQDRLDNGGAFDPDKPTDLGNDIVFRLYDPALRRLPPLPAKPKNEEPKDQ